MIIIKVIFWDFDGVIMNSNEIRDLGFKQVLVDFPKAQVEQLMVFHRKNGGLSRYVKFRYFFEEVRGEKITTEEVSQWATKFSTVMLDLLINEKLLISQTMNFIKEKYKQYQMHIVSGSDGNELRHICHQLGIDHYFDSIHGSPTPKNDLVKEIIQKKNYNPSSCILIGDSINDFEAAKVNGLLFQAYGNTILEEKTTYQLL